MIFDLFQSNYHAMNKLYILLFFSLLMASCSSTKDAGTSAKDAGASSDEMVKSAVEARRYIIKFDRLYANHGAQFELFPRSNFIIIDGERAVISTMYVGAQYDIKPIAAFNMRGIAEDYQLTSKPSKGSYDIQLRMTNGNGTTFKVYLSVSKKGYCNASVSGLKTDNVRYSGRLVPIIKNYPQQQQNQDPFDDMI